jgi:uncharacterized protein (DUF952 family)
MIYHLTTTEAWEKALQTGIYTHPSLKTEGFIHCSEENQVLETAERYFSSTDSVVVLYIVERHVKSILRREPSRDGVLFPHLYGELPLEAIENQSFLVKETDGHFTWLKTRKKN